MEQKYWKLCSTFLWEHLWNPSMLPNTSLLLETCLFPDHRKINRHKHKQ